MYTYIYICACVCVFPFPLNPIFQYHHIFPNGSSFVAGWTYFQMCSDALWPFRGVLADHISFQRMGNQRIVTNYQENWTTQTCCVNIILYHFHHHENITFLKSIALNPKCRNLQPASKALCVGCADLYDAQAIDVANASLYKSRQG